MDAIMPRNINKLSSQLIAFDKSYLLLGKPPWLQHDSLLLSKLSLARPSNRQDVQTYDILLTCSKIISGNLARLAF